MPTENGVSPEVKDQAALHSPNLNSPSADRRFSVNRPLVAVGILILLAFVLWLVQQTFFQPRLISELPINGLVIVSNNGHMLTMADNDVTRVFEVWLGGLVELQPTLPISWDGAFSNDLKEFIQYTGNKVTRWNTETWTIADQFLTVGEVKNIAYAPDDKRLYTVSYQHYPDNEVTLETWDNEQNIKVAEYRWGHNYPLGRIPIALNEDGQLLAVALNINDRSTALYLYDTTTRQVVAQQEMPISVQSLAWQPFHDHLALGTRDKNVYLLETNSMSEVKRFYHRNGAIIAIDFTPDGCFMFAGGSSQPTIIWDVRTGNSVHEFPDANARQMIATIQISRDGQVGIIFTVSDGPSRLRIWDLSNFWPLKNC